MIVVAAIEGEIFDLTTGEGRDRSLLITNGVSFRHISVSDQAIKEVVELFAEAKAHGLVGAAPSVAVRESVAKTVQLDVPVPSAVPNKEPKNLKEELGDEHKYDEAITGVGSI